MTSYEMIQLLDQITSTLNEKKHLTDLLAKAAEYSANIKNTFDEVIGGENKENASQIGGLRANLTNAFAPNLKLIRPRAVFAELDALVAELNSFKNLLPKPAADSLDNLIKEVQDLSHIYEEFIDDVSLKKTFNLIDSGDQLLRSIQGFIHSSLIVKEALQPASFARDGYEEFSLLLPSTISYGDVLVKLTALEIIYSEVCNLMDVSTSEYPLQIIKIESGSLWLKVFGESRVITLLTKLMESGAAFIHRNYTTEGKITAIPKQVETVEAVLQLAERMEKMGIDTSNMKEELQKSSIVISSNLNKLLGGEPSITVNDQTYSLRQAQQERYLDGGKTLLLEDGSNKETD